MRKKVNLLDLRPTQLAVGMKEVREKLKKLRSLDDRELQKEIKRRPLQVVRSPNGDYYIVDGHHRAVSMWLRGVDRVPVKVIERFSRNLSYHAFWREMKKRRWVHLYDQYGDGPRDPMSLACDIRGVGDDPYRSLAWLTECAGAYEKSETAFSSFKWALFFRKHKLIKDAFDIDYGAALKKAVKLARTPAAKHLPGYKGRGRK